MANGRCKEAAMRGRELYFGIVFPGKSRAIAGDGSEFPARSAS
jgi:hypothetical protein